ncbi:MAG: ATP-binding cassette domain-containing protein [Thermoanaerobaculia bacterium]
MTAARLLDARGISKHYMSRASGLGARRSRVAALDDVSIRLDRGETLGLLGESGSGKTTLARILLRLEPPTGGTATFDGLDWLALSGEPLRRARRKIQIVFQDASASLSHRLTAGASIAEPLRGCLGLSGSELRGRVEEALLQVGLTREDADLYPHEFSGGQRQRIAIARAIAPGPDLIVCDEPVSSLDVSISGQILNLFREIQERSGVSYLFISHDPGAVEAVSDRIAVLREGRIVEEGTASELLAKPQTAYTAALLRETSL